MQTKAADDLHPDWKTGLQALAIAEAGKRADAKPSTHPIVQPVLTASQAEQAFDNITYDKGATVIGMLEALCRARSLPRRRSALYAGARLWEYRRCGSLARSAGCRRQARIGRRGGFHHAARVCRCSRSKRSRPRAPRTKIVLSEGRFADDPSTIASAPRSTGAFPLQSARVERQPRTYFRARPPATIAVQGTGPVIVNAGQSSYVRTLYTQRHDRRRSALKLAV